MDERYEVIITNEAEKKLEQIILYLEEEVSYETGDRVRKGLLKVIADLEKNPTSNGIVQEISDKEVIYRRVIKWSYRIIYIIEDVVKIVFILDVDHSRRDPNKLKERFK